MNEWTTAGNLNRGDVFEHNGDFYVLSQTPIPELQRVEALCLTSSKEMRRLARDLQVCPIDISFLLLAAADRLAENDAYQRGLRDGAERMRKAAVDIMLSWGRKWPSQDVVESIDRLPLDNLPAVSSQQTVGGRSDV